jgi:TfoX/Sxy family transcriptional regulator of competence genes
MAYNEQLAARVRELIALQTDTLEEKKMFGGICFLADDKMCVGIVTNRLIVRFDPAMTEEVMEKDGCGPMNFTGKSMRGMAFVAEDALNTTAKLSYWIDLAMEYNKKARPSKKKGK